MMCIRFICLLSLMHIVDSMFSVGKGNKNKRMSLDEVISIPSKKQRAGKTMEASQIKNVLGGNDQRKWAEQGTNKYLEESASSGNPDLVLYETTDSRDDLHKISSESKHEKVIKKRIEELLNNRKSAIEKDNNPGSVYYLIESYLKAVFGKPGEQVENGTIDYATSLLDWFSKSINVQKLELRRYDLTCGFLKAFLRILGLLEIRVLGRYEGLVTIRCTGKYNNTAKKANESRNTKGDTLEHQDYLRETIPHVNVVHIPGYYFATSLTKKGLDETKIYAVLSAWLRETKVERFIYSWKMRYKDKFYSCIVYHNLSKKEENDVIVINLWKIANSNENYICELTENSFPFARTKATTFKIYLGCSIALDFSFIDTLLRNTSAFKCEIIFRYALDMYNFLSDNKEHDNVKNFEYGVKLNNINLFCDNLLECKDFRLIKYVFWDLDTKVSKTDISLLRSFNETGKFKGLKRFTMTFPSQDSKLETAAAFFEVFGNNNGRISTDSHKTLQNILIQYIELETLEELDFLKKNLQQLYISLDTVIKESQGTNIKQLEVHFIYEDVASQEKYVLDINNFEINSDEMALIYKMKVDKLNLRNVIFRWTKTDKNCLDAMVPDKGSRWCGKIYSENIRYTITANERKKIEEERNRILKKIRKGGYYKKNKLKKTCVNPSPSDTWLNEEGSKLMVERNNKILETYEEYKTLWENISRELIINGLEYFGKNNNLTTTTADQVSISDSEDGITFISYICLD